MITSAMSSGGGYQAIPQIVRDFYSKEVFFKAQPRLRFLQFTKVRRDLQAVRGKSIVFTRYNNLTGGGQIAENDMIVPEALSAAEVIISVYEQANAVQITEYLIAVSLMNVVEEASISLANNFAKILDGQLRDVALSTTNVIYGNGATSPATMVAPGAGDPGSALTAETVRAAWELLSANDTPKIQNEFYVCFASPHQIRQLMTDPDWIETNKYFGRRQLYIGEVGMFNGVVFIDTTQMPVLSPTAAAAKYTGYALNIPAYEAVIFGDNTLAWGIAQDVELRDDGVVDMGRKHTLGWYGIWGTGLLDNDYCARIVTI